MPERVQYVCATAQAVQGCCSVAIDGAESEVDLGLSPIQTDPVKKEPRWPLERVKELAKARRFFVQRTRALDFFPSFQAARTAVLGVLLELEIGSYAHTVQLTFDMADVYGIRVEDRGWYLKITIDEQVPEVAVISFHPLERALKTRGGRVTP
jgi:hypothetical protein